MWPQINPQGPLSDLPRLHVVDESNMAAEMAELEICRYPGNDRSKVWEYFGFYQLKEGPKTKENLDMTKVICRLCRKQYANKGLWHVCFVDFVSVSLELLQCNLERNNMHSLVDFSDYNRWSIGWGNPIISDGRLWNLKRFPPLLSINRLHFRWSISID